MNQGAIIWMLPVVALSVFLATGCRQENNGENVAITLSQLEADAARWEDVPVEERWRIDDDLVVEGVVKEIRDVGGGRLVVLELVDGALGEVPLDALPLEQRLLALQWWFQLELCAPVAWLRVPMFSPGVVRLDDALDLWKEEVFFRRPELAEIPISVRLVGVSEVPEVEAKHWIGLDAVRILDMLCRMMILYDVEYDWIYREETSEIILGPVQALREYLEYFEKRMLFREFAEQVRPLMRELGGGPPEDSVFSGTRY